MKVKISLVVVFASLVVAGLAYADGFNMVSTPLIPHDASMQAVFADSMGSGCQLTGGWPAAASDQIKWFDGIATWYTAWYKTSGPGPNGWKGSLTTFEPDRGHWIIVRSVNPAVTLTFTGSVNTDARTITVQPGLSYNFVGTPFAESRPLGGGTGDDCGLLASGFTGGWPAAASDKIRYFNGTTWATAWYKTSGPGPNGWKGLASLDPGNGYMLEVLAGHSFTGNQWIYIANPSKGAKADLQKQTRVVRNVQLKKERNSPAPSTNKSLSREQAVEQKKSR